MTYPLILLLEDTDLVEDPKYVGDASFMDDMPDKYRVDPESKEPSSVLPVLELMGLSSPWFRSTSRIARAVPKDLPMPMWQSRGNTLGSASLRSLCHTCAATEVYPQEVWL